MLSFVWGIITIAITFYLGMIYNSVAFLLLCFLEAVIVVLTFAILVITNRRYKVSMEIPIALAEANKPVKINIIFWNNSIAVLNKAKVLIEYGNTMEKKRKRKWVLLNNLIPERNVITSNVVMNSAGSYCFEIKKLRIYDPFGLMYINKKQNTSDTAMILPELDVIPVQLSEPIRNFVGDADVYDDLRPGQDASQIFDVREYRDGDKIQSIHWKLSAKSEDLVVRENSHPKACALVFYLDPTKAKDSQEFWKYAASFSFSLMDNKCPHFAVWYSKSKHKVVRARVDDEESYYLYITTFMVDVCVKESVDLIALYKDMHRGENFLYELYLGDEVKLNGELMDKNHLELNL